MAVDDRIGEEAAGDRRQDSPWDDQAEGADPETLAAEAADLSKQILRQFVLLIGAGFFMLVTISVSDVKLISGKEEVTLPVVDAPTTLSSLIVFGPVMISGLLIYTHFLLGRLEELRTQGVRPPRIYFFTMRDPGARLFADFCFYVAVPLFCAWFAVRTVFRPETPWLLLMSGTLLVMTATLLMLRAQRRGSAMRRAMALGYAIIAIGVTGAGILAYAIDGRAPFQKVMMAVARLDLEGADLAGSVAPDVSLDGFSFDGMCLEGAKLDGLDLDGASFAGADLTNASLAGARLVGADFTGADLTSARLEGADLTGARLVRARLADGALGSNEADALPAARFANADLTDADLTGVAAVRVNFDDARLARAFLEDADLSGASLLDAAAPSASFRFARLSAAAEGGAAGAAFSRADLTCADFREARGDGVQMMFATAERARFGDATLPGVRLPHARLDQADFTRADLTGALLIGASVENANFSNAILDGVRGLNEAAGGGGAATPDACPETRRLFVRPAACRSVGAAAAR